MLLAAGCGGANGEPLGTKRPEAVAPPAPAVVVAPTPLRRLTREEYNNAVRDLLGDTTRPADAFPPDEVVGGFETNNLAPVTAPLVERYMDTAEALAAAAAHHVDTLAPCPTGHPREVCAKAFIETFGRRIFRRPLDAGERSSLFGIFEEKAGRSDYAGGIQLVLEVMLQSPQFLYRVEAPGPDGADTRALTSYELATRLSFFIWASTPDDALLDAAASDRLSAPDDIAREARRLLKDPRAIEGIRSFHRQWLSLGELDTASKDSVLSAAFTPELKAAMVEETLRFSADAVLSGGDAVKTLLTSNRSFVNAPLAALYGVPPPANGFALVDLPPRQRSGILTQASVMTVLSNADQTSPVTRGKFVRERLLCEAIPPPPPNAIISAPKVDPKLTTKQRFAQHRTDPSCAGCHQLMDPIGFGFEHYDAIGAWREVDGAFPVDSVGEITASESLDGTFDGAVELGARLSASEQVRRCIATQWFRFALGRNERDEDAPSIAAAYQVFAREGFDVRELIVAIATSDAFRYTRFEEGRAP
ncbi:MAG TPA: DUF1592 domain-containing protein [Polyangiaceae bacterium]|nr:DUF1592 domain-containing protein [Polyangiaceae bacterium]